MGKNNLIPLRRLHGKIHDSLKAFHSKKAERKLVRSAIRKSKLQAATSPIAELDYPVDFVVTWVDGSDPLWLAQKAQYTGEKTADINNDASRYRDWDVFQYWFRAVEKNAPWVNKVYLVTWGHLPPWLNTDCPKLKIIKHEDIIPAEYLPTFNSHVIEWNLWRIPELSEHFVYFNDDMFITRQLKKGSFFKNGLPKYCAVAKPIGVFDNMNAHRHARINCFGIMNSYFDIRKCIEENPEKWFNYQYGEEIEYNIRAYKDGLINGMVFSHLGVPFRKTAWESFYNHFSASIDRTCRRRIRSSDDIMHQAVQMWEIFNGSFEPVSSTYYGALYYPKNENIESVKHSIISNKYRMVCINDYEGLGDCYEEIRKQIISAFDEKYPEMSAFEITKE